MNLPLIPVDEFAREFLILRGKAIQKYAELEHSLGSLYAFLMGVPPEIAGITFFKIQNTRSRTAILDKLLKRKCGNTYNVFWNPLGKLLGELDQKRNEIVHWGTIVEIVLGAQDGTQELVLMPSNLWDHKLEPRINGEDLYAFIVKCDFIQRSVNVFEAVISSPRILPDGSTFPVSDAWRDICLQPITYPPPDTHPLSLNYSKP